MARENNRKVLINLHSSALNTMPVGRLFLGEIGVEHSGVDTAKLYVETNATSTTSGTIATFITERAIDTKILGVNNKIDGVVNVLNDLLNITITGATGDDVIKIQVNNPDVSANTLTIRHTSGVTAQSGFLKVAYDKFGHTTGSTAVTISDVSGLTGFADAVNNAVDKTSVITPGTTDNKLTTSKAVSDYVDSKMVGAVTYKGTTATLPSTANTGDLYIATAAFTIPAAKSGTGSAQTVEVGDYVISRASATTWDVIEKNDDGVLTDADVIKDKATFESVEDTDFRPVGAAVLKDEFDTTNGNLNNLSGSVINLSASTKAIETNVTNLSASTVSIKNNLDAVSGNVVTMKTDVSNLSGSVIDLSASTKAIETKVTNLSSSTVAIETKVTNLSSSTVAIESGLNNLSSSTVALSASTVSIKNDLDAVSGNVYNFKTDIANLSGSVIDLSASTKAIETGLNNLSGSVINLSASTKAIETKVTNLSSSTVAIETKVNNLSSSTVAIETGLNNLSGSVVNLSASTVAIKTGLNNLSGSVINLSSSTVAIEDRLNKLSASTVNIETNVTNLSSSTVAIEGDLSDLSGVVQTLSASTITKYVSNISQQEQKWATNTAVTEYNETTITLKDGNTTTDYNIKEWNVIDCGTY